MSQMKDREASSNSDAWELHVDERKLIGGSTRTGLRALYLAASQRARPSSLLGKMRTGVSRTAGFLRVWIQGVGFKVAFELYRTVAFLNFTEAP